MISTAEFDTHWVYEITNCDGGILETLSVTVDDDGSAVIHSSINDPDDAPTPFDAIYLSATMFERMRALFAEMKDR